MATNKERFTQELARITGDDDAYSVTYDGLDDAETVEALVEFANAVNPERSRPSLRKPKADGTLTDANPTWSTAREYLNALRLTDERGFDLLDGTVEEYNDFMLEMVDGDLDAYPQGMERTTASKYQSAARAFYRYCDEPGKSGERPETNVEWPADDIIVFSDASEPRYDESDMFEDDEVDQLREACIRTRNSRRDRAFVEMLAGTAQRIRAIRTLRIRDVVIEPDEGPPHVLLNPEIKGDGDKGAIEHAGRWRPIVSDVAPIREFITHHSLRDADVRARHDAAGEFEDCYLFVGDPGHPDSDPSRPWDDNAIRKMLERVGGYAGVSKPVKPHNFRHWAYSKSKELPIDESLRRQVFGWSAGSTTGDEVYGHVTAAKAGRQFADAWQEAFSESEDPAGVAEQIVGAIAGGELPPEARQAIVAELVGDDDAMAMLTDAVNAHAE